MSASLFPSRRRRRRLARSSVTGLLAVGLAYRLATIFNLSKWQYPTDPDMAAESSPQVLVVDDEPDLADLYDEWLSDVYEVQVAYRGDAALSSLDATLDVVLLDRRIADLSGDEVLEEIRRRGLDCRVAMVTAVTPDEDIVEMGFDDYLVKPVSREDLRELVERLLRRSTHTAELQELFALASKKATLDTEAAGPPPRSGEAYARLEAELEAKTKALEQTLAELDPDDFEMLFYDLETDAEMEG